MSWNIAQAKQCFSEMVRQAAQEPQLIYNRKRLVAAVVGAEEYQAFKEWSERDSQCSLADELAELRRIMWEEDYELDLTPRSTRDNAFVEMLEEEGRDLPR